MKAAALVATAFAACMLNAGIAGAAVARDGQVVMGTILTVTVVAAKRDDAERLAREAIAEAARWDDALTIWRDDGELARFNSRAGQGFVPVSERLGRGLAAMLDLAWQTGGAFDPGVGALPVRGGPHASLDGIRGALVVRPLAPREKDAKRYDASLAFGGTLDSGAVGKGLALDAAIALVASGGATAAFFDFGGSSQSALGAPPGDGAGWTVLVSGLEPGSTHAAIKLRDRSLSTSRSGATDTRPVLDPRTRIPVAEARLVTVTAASATAADAWSTALVVLGAEGIEIAESRAISVFIEDARGVHASKASDLQVAKTR